MYKFFARSDVKGSEHVCTNMAGCNCRVVCKYSFFLMMHIAAKPTTLATCDIVTHQHGLQTASILLASRWCENHVLQQHQTALTQLPCSALAAGLDAALATNLLLQLRPLVIIRDLTTQHFVRGWRSPR